MRLGAFEEQAGAGLGKLVGCPSLLCRPVEVLPVSELAGHADEPEGCQGRRRDPELLEGRAKGGGQRLMELALARLEALVDAGAFDRPPTVVVGVTFVGRE